MCTATLSGRGSCGGLHGISTKAHCIILVVVLTQMEVVGVGVVDGDQCANDVRHGCKRLRQCCSCQLLCDHIYTYAMQMGSCRSCTGAGTTGRFLSLLALGLRRVGASRRKRRHAACGLHLRHRRWPGGNWCQSKLPLLSTILTIDPCKGLSSATVDKGEVSARSGVRQREVRLRVDSRLAKRP